MAGICADIPRKTFLVRFAAVVAALLVALVAAWHPFVASAVPVGSITLDCSVDGVPLVGDTYGLVCVADVTYDEAAGILTSYATRDAFASFGYDWISMKSSELDEAAKALATHAGEKSLYESTAVSDSSGSVGFSQLGTGLYLVSRIGVAAGNEGYACDPLLLCVPLVDGGQLMWSVDSRPKFERTVEDGPDDLDKPEEPDVPGNPGQSEEPGTPDKARSPLFSTGVAAFTGVGVLLVLGGIAIVVAGRLRARR